MKKRKRVWIPGAILVLAILVVAEYLYLAPINDNNTGQGEGHELYTGSKSCQSCHPTQYRAWEHSHHAQAMAVASAETVKGDFNTTFTSQGVTSRFFRNGADFFVNTEGPDGVYYDFKIAYTFGVEPLQQYIAAFPNGRMQCLRTAWNTVEKRWFDLYPDDKIDPGEWLHWSQGGLNWNTMCSDCHSTHVRKNFSAEKQSYNTTFSQINIGCEACHGPGKKHVDLVSSPAAAPNTYSTTGITTLRGQDQIEQCAQCHSRRMQLREGFRPGEKFMNYYAPEILRDDLYYPDGQIREELFEYGSFLQSKMFQNGVKCTDCHDSHSLGLKEIGNKLCVQCHASQRYDTQQHHFHKTDNDGAQCINCHMPGRYYMENDFRRDHSLRVPRPDLTIKYNTPNACNQCHQNQSAEWASQWIEQWFGPDRTTHFSETLALASTRSEEAIAPLIALLNDVHQPGIARATAIWYLDQIVSQEAIDAIARSVNNADPLVRYTAANALADLPANEKTGAVVKLLDDSIAAIRQAAASALADVPPEQIDQRYRDDFERSMRGYEDALKLRADFPGGQLEKGILYLRRGQTDGAEKAFLDALALDNRFNAARINLAHLYNRQGANNKAIALFKTVIKQEPAFGTAYYALGLLYAEENNLYEAVRYLSKAAVLDTNPRIFYNLGAAFQQLNQREKAAQTYLKGLQLNPADRDLMYVLSLLYIQEKKFDKAKPYADALKKRYPAQAQINELIRRVEQNR